MNTMMMKKVKKGQYCTLCCHLDLERADEDFIDEDGIYQVWDTLDEAIEEIKQSWGKDEESLLECDKVYEKLRSEEASS